MPYERPVTERLNSYANIEADRARQAREAANSLFKPRQQAAVVDDHIVKPDVPTPTPAPPARVPRLLTVSEPPLNTEMKSAPVPQPIPDSFAEHPSATNSRFRPSKQPTAKIPESEYGRIHTLATYGMTISQVAEVYAVPESDIERIVKKVAGTPRLSSGEA